MAESFMSRVKNAWNAFTSRDPPNNPDPYQIQYRQQGYTYTDRPDRPRFTRGNERSIVTSIYNRIAVDCAQISIKHVRVDADNRFVSEINSGLNSCLTLEANKDQAARAFLMDAYMSLLDEGCIAIVPIDTDVDPGRENSYEIYSLRVGKITQWWPDFVRVNLYNDRNGKHQEIVVPKSTVAIIDNPFYAVMNEKNSTLQRLVRKLNLLDMTDEQNSSGKLDLIIQLPYIIKSEARRQQAEQRRKDIEVQLASSKYGIAYTDGTEHITQLNRAVENKLLAQVQYLTELLYSQLGLTTGILDGSADEQTKLSYQTRIMEPLAGALVEEFKRKFLTKTARSQKQSIVYFLDPFKLVPVSQIAEIADKFTRNEIMSSNEIRQIVGLKPVDNEQADELRNKNLNPGEGQTFATTDGKTVETEVPEEPGKEQKKVKADVGAMTYDELLKMVME